MAQTQQTFVSHQPQPAQPTILMMPVQNAVVTQPGYNSETTRKCVKVISILQILFGVVCFIFQITTMAIAYQLEEMARMYNYDYWGLSWFDMYVAPGIWIGVYYIVTGIIGLLSSTRKSKCLIIAMMVLNIILAAGFSTTFIGLMAGSVDRLGYHYRCYYKSRDYNNDYGRYVDPDYGRYYTTTPTSTTTRGPCDLTDYQVALALDCIMLILAVINFIFGICLSAVGCCNTCCKSSSGRPMMSGQPMVICQAGAQPQQRYMMNQPGVVYTQPGAMYAQPQPGYQGATQMQPSLNQPGGAYPQTVAAYPVATSSQSTDPAFNHNQPGQTGSLPPAYQEKAEQPGVHTHPQ